MRIRPALYCLLLLLPFTGAGQTPLWEHISNEVYYHAQLKRFGNNLLVRGKSRVPEELGSYTINYDLDGNKVWEKKGRTVAYGPSVIEKALDGNYITGDQLWGSPNANDFNIFLQKRKPNGDTTTWNVTYPTPYLESIGSIHQLQGGDLLISSQSQPYGYNFQTFTLRRTDSLGTVIWYKHHAKNQNTYGPTTLVNRRGNFTMLGRLTRPPRPPAITHMFLIEVDQNGDSILGKQLVLFDSTREEDIFCPSNGFIEAANGDYIFTGHVRKSNNQHWNGFVARVDSAFNIIWAYEQASQNPQYNFYTNKVAELEDGTILFIGYDLPLQPQLYLIRLSAGGQFMSQTALQNQVCTNGLEPWDWALLPDSSIVLSGKCGSNVNSAQAYIGRWSNLGLPTIHHDTTLASVPGQVQAYSAKLGQSYPNPATAQAVIEYTLPAGVEEAGIVLRELVTGRITGRHALPLQAGKAQLQVALNKYAAGTYVYSLSVNHMPAGTGKLVVIK